MWVRPLGWEDPLEKEVATHSSILAQKIPWTEEPGVHGVAKKIDIEDYIKVKWIKEVADKIS